LVRQFRARESDAVLKSQIESGGMSRKRCGPYLISGDSELKRSCRVHRKTGQQGVRFGKKKNVEVSGFWGVRGERKECLKGLGNFNLAMPVRQPMYFPGTNHSKDGCTAMEGHHEGLDRSWIEALQKKKPNERVQAKDRDHWWGETKVFKLRGRRRGSCES